MKLVGRIVNRTPKNSKSALYQPCCSVQVEWTADSRCVKSTKKHYFLPNASMQGEQ